jgi:hypothetical protein
MNNIKENLSIGLKEGWTLFWSPFVGTYRAVQEVISSKHSKAGIKISFSSGLREAWAIFWSPFRTLYKAAKAILTSK